MKKSVSRIVARERGEKVYVPENPCKKGHMLRRVTTGNCIECKRDYEKKTILKDRAKYNLRKKEERKNKLDIIASKARLQRANESPEKRAIRLEKARLNAKKWREKNVGNLKIKECKRLYKARNPDAQVFYCAKRRASLMQRIPKWLTPDDIWLIKQAYSLARLRTKMFGFQWHVDHVIPLQGKFVSGLHVPTNLQVIPWNENVSKANKFSYLPR